MPKFALQFVEAIKGKQTFEKKYLNQETNKTTNDEKRRTPKK